MGRLKDYTLVTTVEDDDVLVMDGVEGTRTILALDLPLALGIRSLPEPPSEDGNYVLKLVVSEGIPTYNWVAEE